MKPGQTQAGQYQYFQELWEQPQPAPILSCPAMWDERADEWVRMLQSDDAHRVRQTERVEATAAFLRKNGLLGSGTSALDIGCGPGLFTLGFAKTAEQVTGVDISPRMVAHAQSRAQKQGVDNAAFLALNFKEADVAALGWHKKFDLAMACLTPAVTGVQDLHKLMSASRGHCLHISFVHTSDSLRDRITTELYPAAHRAAGHGDGRVFYAVFNLLFLEGYCPKTHFFHQAADVELTLDETLARRYAARLHKEAPERDAEAERIYDCLARLCQKEGGLRRRTAECYGFLLWNVNEKRPEKVPWG